MSRTIPERKLIPVVLDGYKRVFNVDLSPDSDEDTVVLNVEKDDKSHINVVMFEVSEEELKLLKIREKHYDFISVDVTDMDGNLITDCIVSIDYDDDIHKGGKLPKPGYLKLCRRASEKISPEFLEEFDSTTFLADGRTLKEIL